MAKMFYTMEETKSALSKNEEEVKQLAREGKLREFRDGSRLMFKADQVEQLKSELGGGGSGEPVTLSPEAESGAPIGLVDSRGSSGSAFALADSAGPALNKEDTHLAAEAGLSGSFSALASPGKSDSRAGSRTGITLDFDDKADPGAQTAVNPALHDQVTLDGAGSGSGLLDLTRESDDTSLGAVFDELSPSGARRPTSTPSAALETQAGEDVSTAVAERVAHAAISAPVHVIAKDAVSCGLAWASVAATIVVCFGAFILGAATLGYHPSILHSLRYEDGFMTYFAGAAGGTLLLFIVGLFVGKSGK